MGLFDWFKSQDTSCVKCGSLILNKQKMCSVCESKKTEGIINITSDPIEEVKESKKKTTFNSKLRVHTNDTELIESIRYYQGKPFTGICYSLYSNGNLYYETEKLNGLDHGSSKQYSSDGILHSIVNYSYGKLHDKDREKVTEFLQESLIMGIKEIEHEAVFNLLNNNLAGDTGSLQQQEMASLHSSKVSFVREMFLLPLLNITNKKIWNKDLHITKPDEISLLVPAELQKVECWNYFLDKKPFTGIVYYVHNEQEWSNSLNLSDLMSTPEEERLKLIDYEFDVKDGVKDGKCRSFNKQQNLIREFEIKEDIKNGIEKEYNEKHYHHQFFYYSCKMEDVLYEQVYKNNLRHGLEKTYYDNGKLESQKEWVNGKCTGTLKFFHESGKLALETTYQNGEHKGPQKCWNEIGQEVECGPIPSIHLSTEEDALKKQEEEEDRIKELENKKSDILTSKEKDYKKVQDIIDVDVTKLKFFSFYSLEDWFIDVLKNHKDFDYYLICTDYHTSGGFLQFEKSDTNTNSKVISEFKDEYDPSSQDNEDYDETNDVYENNEGFSTFQIWKVTSSKFPELIKNKIDEFIKDNGEEKDVNYEFLEWLNEDIGFVNFESCELMMESLGLNRDKDLELIIDELKLNIVRDYSSSLDLTNNPLVIRYGGYYQCGEHELFLGVIEK